jgi:hypothetical protein
MMTIAQTCRITAASGGAAARLLQRLRQAHLCRSCRHGLAIFCRLDLLARKTSPLSVPPLVAQAPFGNSDDAQIETRLALESEDALLEPTTIVACRQQAARHYEPRFGLR